MALGNSRSGLVIVGIVPVRQLLCSCSCHSDEMFSNDAGTLPTRRLPEICNCCRLVMLPHDGGSVPPILLELSARSWRLVIVFQEQGNVPDTFVPKMYSPLSCDMLDHSDGKVPL
ncbi:surface antigen, putative, partial [Bodo saltans]